MITMNTSLLLCCILCLLRHGYASKQPSIHIGAPNPATIAQLITQQIVNNSNNFLQWDYGCSIIFDAMWEALSVFGGDYESVLNKKLDEYETTPGNYGTNSVLRTNSSYNNTDDLQVAYAIARDGCIYVVPYPYKLHDGTYSRQSGWAAPCNCWNIGETGGNHTFVWADDSFMGMALLSRLAIMLNNPGYLTTIVNQQITYAEHLRDATDGLFHHGYNDEDRHQSCCKWSRANGWLMMSHVEVMLAMQHLSYEPTLFEQIKSVFVAHAMAAAKYQSTDGRWHQLLNETSTFLETSTTGMFLLSFITGVANGWLERTEFGPVIEGAWRGLASTVMSSGIVTGICCGTGIGTDVAEYEARPTDYLASSPGLGSVLRAVTAYHKYSQNL